MVSDLSQIAVARKWWEKLVTVQLRRFKTGALLIRDRIQHRIVRL